MVFWPFFLGGGVGLVVFWHFFWGGGWFGGVLAFFFGGGWFGGVLAVFLFVKFGMKYERHS